MILHSVVARQGFLYRIYATRRLCGAIVYKCFPPAVVEGLEGEKSGHVICGYGYIKYYYYITLHKCSHGTPKPERRMGRSLTKTLSFVLVIILVSIWTLQPHFGHILHLKFRFAFKLHQYLKY